MAKAAIVTKEKPIPPRPTEGLEGELSAVLDAAVTITVDRAAKSATMSIAWPNGKEEAITRSLTHCDYDVAMRLAAQAMLQRSDKKSA